MRLALPVSRLKFPLGREAMSRWDASVRSHTLSAGSTPARGFTSNRMKRVRKPVASDGEARRGGSFKNQRNGKIFRRSSAVCIWSRMGSTPKRLAN